MCLAEFDTNGFWVEYCQFSYSISSPMFSPILTAFSSEHKFKGTPLTWIQKGTMSVSISSTASSAGQRLTEKQHLIIANRPRSSIFSAMFSPWTVIANKLSLTHVIFVSPNSFQAVLRMFFIAPRLGILSAITAPIYFGPYSRDSCNWIVSSSAEGLSLDLCLVPSLLMLMSRLGLRSEIPLCETWALVSWICLYQLIWRFTLSMWVFTAFKCIPDF